MTGLHRVAPVLAAVLMVTPSAKAQVSVTADFGAFSEYDWRGVTFTNRPVAQPDVFVTVTRGNNAFTTGVWTNVELRGYNGAHDISVVGGKNGTSATAWTFWGEGSRTVGRATFTGGVNAYAYPTTNGIAAAYNSVEPYAKVSVTAPLNPRVTVFYDVDKIRGAYIEGVLTHNVALGHSRVLALAATGGWSAGQEVRAGSTEAAYFELAGPVVIDLSAVALLPLRGITFSPAVHVTRALDSFTGIVAPGRSELVKVWAGVSIGYSRQLGKAH